MRSLSEYGRTTGRCRASGTTCCGAPGTVAPCSPDESLTGSRDLIATCVERGWTVEALEVKLDQVHPFARCSPDASPARLAHQVKAVTSRVLRQEVPHLRSPVPTPWSRSCFVASLGQVSEATIHRYIAEQTTRPTKGAP
jgi:REP element-mobilizing transposase RayT